MKQTVDFKTQPASQIPLESSLAYVKRLDNSRGYAICSADGRELAVFPTRELAVVTAKRHDFEAVSVH